MSDPVVIVPTGTANLASVRACFKRLGADTTLATSAAQVSKNAAPRMAAPNTRASMPEGSWVAVSRR